jgi:hypothetical protein
MRAKTYNMKKIKTIQSKRFLPQVASERKRKVYGMSYSYDKDI